MQKKSIKKYQNESDMKALYGDLSFNFKHLKSNFEQNKWYFQYWYDDLTLFLVLYAHAS